MKKQKLFLSLFFLFLVSKSSSQDFSITPTKLEFDGNQLLIYYDIIDKNQADQFYIWVEIEKKNGEPIAAKALSGDIGEKIKAGLNKKIIWVPEKDSIFLNEEVFVEVKAEKYIKSFNKGSMLLMSTVFPGLGQTKISKGKPWWLTGVAAYGAMAGGFIVNKNSHKTYNSYIAELVDISKRADLRALYEKQINSSNTLIISGIAIWAANIIWVALTPNQYQPLQIKVTLVQSTCSNNGAVLIAMKLNF
jgi:hypothetical protein